MPLAVPAIYHTYAQVYDLARQGQAGEQAAFWLLEWLSRRQISPRRALDLGCGTGAAALKIAAAGIPVVAIDQSAAMLTIARSRTQAAGYPISFVQADLRRLRINGREPAEPVMRRASFDLITCVGGPLDYLVGDEDLARLLNVSAALLAPGGYLAFDLPGTPHCQPEDVDMVVYDGPDLLVYHTLSQYADTPLVYRRIVWMVREIERWWRAEETHTIRHWDAEDAGIALDLAHLELLDLSGELPEGMLAGRTLYLAHKPARQPA